MLTLAFMMGGPWDIAIVGGVVLLLFGGSKLAGFGKNLGEGIKEFKKATTDEDAPTPPPATPASTAPAVTTVVTSKPEEN